MNNIAGASAAAGTYGRRHCVPIPSSVPCILAPLLLAGIAFSLFILVVVHNALLLVALLLLSALVVSFILWNFLSFRRNLAVLLFVDRLPASDLLTASDGQLVKITGLAACGDFPLESSYEKVGRCVYTSTLLYECSRFEIKTSGFNDHHAGSGTTNAYDRYFFWKLTYLERFAADFYVTDAKSGIRALVKAGYDSNVIPLVSENLIVNTTKKNRVVSSTLKKWLEEKSLPVDARLLRLEEGYIEEGASLTVVGMLSKKNGILMIVPPSDAISTGGLLQKLLLPVDIYGLILRFSNRS